MSELKRCPFCGGEARTASVFGRAGVICTECDANIRMFLDASMEDAIEAWNTRKPMDRIVERLEEIEESLYIARDSIGVDIYKNKESHEHARKLLLQELAFHKAIEIVKEEGVL